MAPLQDFFQLGYVTNDLDAAVALYGRRFGAGRFLTFDTGAMVANAPYPARIGLAHVGRAMVELIQPRGEPAPLYADALPREGFGIQLHHLGYLLRDEAAWTAAMAGLAEQDIPIASRSTAGDLFEVVYADTRPLVGHYIEYVWARPDGMKFFDNVPRN